MSARVIACPQCGTPVTWGPAAPDRPFCSPRCRLTDLGAWAEERYAIPTAEGAQDAFEDDDSER